MWGNMMGCGGMMGWGGGAGFGIGQMIWWGLLIGLGVVLVRGVTADRGPREADRALQILKERYSRGEIDRTEFETRKHGLT